MTLLEVMPTVLSNSGKVFIWQDCEIDSYRIMTAVDYKRLTVRQVYRRNILLDIA
jgi:hypothetical protein